MTFEEFGQDLRAQRVARNVSLTEISADTRINQRFLEAIERGQFSVLPQTYIRAFLREYASAVGIPPEQVLERYAEVSKTEPSAPVSISETPSRPSAPLPGPRTPGPTMVVPAGWRPYIFGGIFLAAGLLAVYVLVDPTGDPAPATTSGEIPFDRVIRETEAAIPADSIPRYAGAPAPPSLAVTDSLTLEMTTIDSVWINIVVDDRTAEDYLFAPERRRVWKARERFTLTMGNAGGATFRLNGKDLGPLGRRGAVLRNSLITADLLR